MEDIMTMEKEKKPLEEFTQLKIYQEKSEEKIKYWKQEFGMKNDKIRLLKKFNED